jgi:uncharacterized iron-regulated protein
MNCRSAVTLRALRLWGICLLVTVLSACESGLLARAPDQALLNQLLPADVLLLGEQHDAPAHQARQRKVLNGLLARGELAALVIEMAEQGASSEGLPPDSAEAQVRASLRWTASEAAGWDWTVYGSLVMNAVQAGVPVLGGNLPRAALRGTMQDASLDTRLSPMAWNAQQTQIREGHCGLLPESQVVPMTRVQVARDLTMARTAQAAVRPGKTVLLVAGNQHVRRDLGVPLHLNPALVSKTVVMASGESVEPSEGNAAHQVWRTAPTPERDHCAEFKTQMAR